MHCLEDDDAQAQELEETDPEVSMLREQIRMLTKQFYTERQQWLEEKRRLQEASKPLQTVPSSHTEDGPGRPCSRQDGNQRANSSVLLCSEAGSEAVCEDAVQGIHNGREPCSSSCSSAKSTNCTSPHQTGSSTSPTNVSEASSPELADTQRQLEECRRHHESASVRWSLEREALQRQIHALISMSGGVVGRFNTACVAEGQDGLSGGNGDSNQLRGHTAQDDEEERLHLLERVSELEFLVEELQAERTNMEEQLRVLAADAAAARRATRKTAHSLPPPSPLLTSRASLDDLAAATMAATSAPSGGGLVGVFCAGAPPEGAHVNVNVTELLAEKAALQRELRALRCQLESAAVPQAGHQRPLRQDAEPVSQEAVAAIEAAASSPSPFSSPSLQVMYQEEHRRLLAAVQERDALAEQAAALQQRVLEAEATAAAAVAAAEAAAAQKKEEEKAAALIAAEADAAATAAEIAAAADVAAMQFELTTLREQLAASVGASVAESSRLAAQVSELKEEVEMLTSRNAELVAEAGAVRQALVSGQVQASDEAFAAAAAAEMGRAAAEAGLLEAQRRIAALQAELVAARKAVEAAVVERDRLAVELAAVRDAALITSQALADCLHGRYSQGGATSAANATTAAAAADPAVANSFIVREPGDPSSLSQAEPGLHAAEALLEAAKVAAEAAQAERDKALQEVEAMRLALADRQAAREAAEAAAAAATTALAAVTRDLDATKLELAEARQLELLFQSKRDVFHASKRVTRGLPHEWIYGSAAVAAAPRSGGVAAAASEQLPPPPPRQVAQREVVSVPLLAETDVEEDGTSTETDSQPAAGGTPPR
ncbi:hypothetical protein VaNZ11_014592 [Volvox africanus]|uniref:Uncharacterized protein n=1 Tax=Volvox africanus TaxID=51714 RepID=A0ABQ5SK60_9CHLO|nr:hypothetical protein VaNZ11_014592 [Volvox africanus]